MIGEKLVRAGIITKDQRDEALEFQDKTGEPFGDALLRLGHLTEERLLHILGLEFNTKFISTERLSRLAVPDKVIGNFPRSLAEHHSVFPVVVDWDKSTVSVVCGTNIEQQVLDMVSQLCGFKEVQAYVAVASAVRALINKHYHGDARAFDEAATTPHAGSSGSHPRVQAEPRQSSGNHPKVSAKPGTDEEPAARRATGPHDQVGPPSIELDHSAPAGTVGHIAEPPEARITAEGRESPLAELETIPLDAPRTVIGPGVKPVMAPKRSDAGPPAAAPRAPAAAPRAPAGPPPATPREISAPPVVSTGATRGIDSVLTALVQQGGSDLHLSSGQPPKMRMDGDIRPLPGHDTPLSSEDIDRLMRPAAPDHIQEQYDADGDADFAHEVPGMARFRMNWFRNIRGEAAVMRTIPTKVPTLEELGFPPVLKSLCELSKGLVVVTGPTGSGKSTTLAAMVDYINRKKSHHIITIEDPVEFVHHTHNCLINQREVHTHTESFARALRAALREDPDIVLVGEMRDLETVHIAIETAETGHLVFGTLHTTTAPSTVDRIIDQFPADRQSQIRVMLSESLRGVLAQTLCKRKEGGRVAAMEILVVNHAISNLIREGKTYQIPSIMQTSKGSGMQTMIVSLLELVEQGVITAEEAVAKAVDQTAMAAALENAGYTVKVVDVTR